MPRDDIIFSPMCQAFSTVPRDIIFYPDTLISSCSDHSLIIIIFVTYEWMHRCKFEPILLLTNFQKNRPSLIVRPRRNRSGERTIEASVLTHFIEGMQSLHCKRMSEASKTLGNSSYRLDSRMLTFKLVFL